MQTIIFGKEARSRLTRYVPKGAYSMHQPMGLILPCTTWHVPDAGQHIVPPLTAAIFKDAPHPTAAKLFMKFLLDPEQQAITGTWSPRTDVPPPAGYKPIFSYLVANDYKDLLTDETHIVELRKRFETYTGPIVNVGGVR